ncbi:MAG: divergent polysaccharide deacetylase family protein [SAR324 cluster bacterium]|nr:divergent polysaccharide deacetylase family protein [SAR324 cluster bacterium]
MARPAETHGRDTGPETGRLAIIIDDIGHDRTILRRFLALQLPLTYSILPGLSHSRAAAGLIRREKQQFLIHLPMEPFRYPVVNPGPSPLLLSYDVDTTRRLVQSYFAQLPGAIGASNHMGSAYTFDLEKMAVVQQVVQQVVAGGKGVFLNSLTSNSRVPKTIARERGFPYLERNVFLDNVLSEAAIRRQLARAISIARRRGWAITVGHPHWETLRVLKAEFSAARRGAVRLVPLTRLVTTGPPAQRIARAAVHPSSAGEAIPFE